jgi:hypothetical protein
MIPRCCFTGLLATLACGGTTPDVISEQKFTIFEVESLTTRLREQDQELQLDTKLAFSLRAYCPKIERVQYHPDASSSFGVLQIWGSDLERVWGVVGRSEDGTFGSAKSKPESDGSLRFALGCRDCVVLLGMEVNGQRVACLGPGHSLQLKNSKLIY